MKVIELLRSIVRFLDQIPEELHRRTDNIIVALKSRLAVILDLCRAIVIAPLKIFWIARQILSVLLAMVVLLGLGLEPFWHEGSLVWRFAGAALICVSSVVIMYICLQIFLQIATSAPRKPDDLPNQPTIIHSSFFWILVMTPVLIVVLVPVLTGIQLRNPILIHEQKLIEWVKTAVMAGARASAVQGDAKVREPLVSSESATSHGAAAPEVRGPQTNPAIAETTGAESHTRQPPKEDERSGSVLTSDNGDGVAAVVEKPTEDSTRAAAESLSQPRETFLQYVGPFWELSYPAVWTVSDDGTAVRFTPRDRLFDKWLSVSIKHADLSTSSPRFLEDSNRRLVSQITARDSSLGVVEQRNCQFAGRPAIETRFRASSSHRALWLVSTKCSEGLFYVLYSCDATNEKRERELFEKVMSTLAINQ